MTRENRNSLLIVAVVLVLAMLACISPTRSAPTEEGQAGWIVSTDASPPALTEAPGPTEAPGATACTFGSSYVADVTVPDNTILLPNTPFAKTWRVRNSGSCDWEAGTKFAYVSGDPLGGPPTVDVPPTAAGSNVDITVNFTSPGSPGTYHSNWQVQRPDGTRFGQQLYVQIVVPEPTAPPTDTPLPTAVPTDAPLPTAKSVGEWPLFRNGDEGPEVFAIQYLLQAEGYSLSADGKFGPQTTAAVKNFQQKNGLTADGIVGPNTWQALIQGHTVKSGNSGDAVRAVQHLLRYKHGHDIKVDGAFGRGTDAAVRDLQKVYGLTVDGIVGKNTWKALVAGL